MLDTQAEARSLKAMLDSAVRVSDDGDRALICASVINIYVECNKRIHKKELMTPGDFTAIMKIIDILFGPLKEPTLSPESNGNLSPEQEKQLLTGLEKQL